jgi:hypothetical protein
MRRHGSDSYSDVCILTHTAATQKRCRRLAYSLQVSRHDLSLLRRRSFSLSFAISALWLCVLDYIYSHTGEDVLAARALSPTFKWLCHTQTIQSPVWLTLMSARAKSMALKGAVSRIIKSALASIRLLAQKQERRPSRIRLWA